MGKSKGSALHQTTPDIYVDDRLDYLLSAPLSTSLIWCDQGEVQKVSFDSIGSRSIHRTRSLLGWVESHFLAEECQAPVSGVLARQA